MSLADLFAEVSALPVVVRPGDSFVITRKFLDGMLRYAAGWPGPVAAVMDPVREAVANLDQIEVQAKDLSFEIQPMPFDSAALRDFLLRCGFVHWGPHHRLHDLAGRLAEAGVPNVYCTEYSLRTRFQIVAAETKNPLLRWRRQLWHLLDERRIRHCVSQATGFEANGTPTFDAYRPLNPRHRLYFDTRMTASMQIDESALERRLARSSDPDRPLHLVFSGRLDPMKGAMDLLALATELRRRGIRFRMTICGGGSLEATMRARIESEQLGEHVSMAGILPFAERLVPFLQAEADLFVCCHVQGDPSCTYLETFGCGVPIVGYDNEAFAGLLERVDAGWAVPTGDVRTLADRVTALASDRPAIGEKARRALAFASCHTFEETFARRMAFFREIAAEGDRASGKSEIRERPTAS